MTSTTQEATRAIADRRLRRWIGPSAHLRDILRALRLPRPLAARSGLVARRRGRDPGRRGIPGPPDPAVCSCFVGSACRPAGRERALWRTERLQSLWPSSATSARCSTSRSASPCCLEYLAPVMLIGWHWARTHRRPAVPVLAGAGLSIVGLAFVLDLRGGLTLNPIGVAWGLGAALCLVRLLPTERRQRSRRARKSRCC